MPRQYESDFAKSGKPYKPYVPPRIYEQNLIDPYLRPVTKTPRLYETGPNGVQDLYTRGQRLYESDIINANTPHPSPYETLAGQGRAGAGYGPINTQGYPLSGPKTGTQNIGNPNGPGNIGPGSGAGEVPPPPEIPVDPSIAAQSEFIKRMTALRDETMAGYGPTSDSIRATYGLASADLRDPYNDYYNKYREGAANAGLDFEHDDNVKLADLAARKLQENYDLNMSSDLATIDKMKNINNDSFTQMLIAANARQIGPGLLADQEALAAAANAGGGSGGGGGGGGGRRSGSSSSSSSDNPFSEKAVQDENFFNPGVATDIASIADPQLRSYVDFMYAGSGTNPQTALTNTTKDLTKFNSFKPPAVTAHGNQPWNQAVKLMQMTRKESAKAKNERNKKLANAAIKWWKEHSAGYTPRVAKQTVQTSSTTKHT